MHQQRSCERIAETIARVLERLAEETSNAWRPVLSHRQWLAVRGVIGDGCCLGADREAHRLRVERAMVCARELECHGVLARGERRDHDWIRRGMDPVPSRAVRRFTSCTRASTTARSIRLKEPCWWWVQDLPVPRSRSSSPATGRQRAGYPVCGPRVLDPSVIIWCTGSRCDYSWIQLPVLDDSGDPRHRGGVAFDMPGLFFVGLRFQHRLRSSLVGGVGEDAAFIAEQLSRRADSLSVV